VDRAFKISRQQKHKLFESIFLHTVKHDQSGSRYGGKNILHGFRINLTTSFFPDELTSAGSVNLNCDKNSLAVEISKEFIETIRQNNITAEYRRRLFVLGKTVEFNLNGAKHIAEAVDINEKCNLIVRYPDKSFGILSSGEISIKI
jgi:biotin-(acetyl-CoA carboxylase) ligase